MKTYIVTYTLRDPGKDYMPLYNAIKNNVEDYRHIMESAWVVKMDKTAKELRDILIPHMSFSERSCDFLFIAEINGHTPETADGMIANSYWAFINDTGGKNDGERKEMNKQYRFDYLKEQVEKWNPNVPKTLNQIEFLPFYITPPWIMPGEEYRPMTDYYGEVVDDFEEWFKQRHDYCVKLAEEYKK